MVNGQNFSKTGYHISGSNKTKSDCYWTGLRTVDYGLRIQLEEAKKDLSSQVEDKVQEKDSPSNWRRQGSTFKCSKEPMKEEAKQAQDQAKTRKKELSLKESRRNSR